MKTSQGRWLQWRWRQGGGDRNRDCNRDCNGNGNGNGNSNSVKGGISGVDDGGNKEGNKDKSKPSLREGGTLLTRRTREGTPITAALQAVLTLSLMTSQ
jgi:hypothetical protein